MFARHQLRMASVVALSSLAVISFTATSAQAQRRSRPTATTTTTTTTTPTTTSAPTPISASIVIVPANSYAYQFTALFYLQVSPASRLGDAELLSGPATLVGVNDFGRVSFYGAVANADYTFRYRNKVLVAGTQTFVYSPWVTFTFRAPQL